MFLSVDIDGDDSGDEVNAFGVGAVEGEHLLTRSVSTGINTHIGRACCHRRLITMRTLAGHTSSYQATSKATSCTV